MPLRIDEVQQDMRKGIQRRTFSNAESSKLRGTASEKTQSLYLTNGLITGYKPERQ